MGQLQVLASCSACALYAPPILPPPTRSDVQQLKSSCLAAEVELQRQCTVRLWGSWRPHRGLVFSLASSPAALDMIPFAQA